MLRERFLPEPKDLEAFLQEHSSPNLSEVFEQTLVGPLSGFLELPGKRFRKKLLHLVFCLEAGTKCSERDSHLCNNTAEVVEAIHAASMIIDDIEDQSLERRGKPTLHLKVGTAVAINAGNWLYFWPLWQIRRLELTPDMEVQIQRLCTEAILKAHCGQAIDVGANLKSMAQSRVRETSLAALELKTGALIGLSAELGAVLAGAVHRRVEAWRAFGVRLGVALQMFDDLGNFASSKMGVKRFEDLKLRRPGWIWAVAADSTPQEFARFCEVAEQLPDDGPLLEFADQIQIVARARVQAEEYLQNTIDSLEAQLELKENSDIRNLCEELRRAYA